MGGKVWGKSILCKRVVKCTGSGAKTNWGWSRNSKSGELVRKQVEEAGRIRLCGVLQAMVRSLDSEHIGKSLVSSREVK